MKSYLVHRKQQVEVNGKRSHSKDISIGTPQGSRLSPLLFIILMADLKLWTENSSLSNFADDTQSIIKSDSRENLLEITSKEASNVVKFFASNNAEKAAALYNGNGKGECIKIKNIGSEIIQSSFSEKLLGPHQNSNFGWSTHIEKISLDLKKG